MQIKKCYKAAKLIPIFTSQLEKARESTDAANLRALYAETAADSLRDDGAEKKSTEYVTLTQTGDWDYVDDIAGVSISNVPKSGNVYVTVKTDGTVEFTNN